MMVFDVKTGRILTPVFDRLLELFLRWFSRRGLGDRDRSGR